VCTRDLRLDHTLNQAHRYGVDDYDCLSPAVVVRYTVYKAQSTSGKVSASVTRLDLAHIMRWSGAIALKDVL